MRFGSLRPVAIGLVMAIIAALAYLSLFYPNKLDEDPTIRRYENAVNVKKTGAKGDGKTDDTKAIQKAINEAAASGKIVYVPRGIYVINPERPLNMPSGTRLYGDGKESVLQADPHRFGWELVRVHGKRIDIRHLFMDGNNAVNRVAVVRAGSQDVSFSSVFAANASQSDDPGSIYYNQMVAGIVIYGETERINIAHSEVYNIYARHDTEGTRIARGIYVTTTWGNQETVAREVKITDSAVHHVGPADNGDCVYYEDPNRRAAGSGERAERAEPNQTGGEKKAGSEAEPAGADEWAEHDEQVASVDTGSLLERNQFSFCATRAVYIGANGVTVDNNRIDNLFQGDNKFEGGPRAGQKAPDMYAGISINADHVMVRNNALEGAGSYYTGIELGVYETVRNVQVIANRITMGNGSDITGTTSIRIGKADGFVVSDNQLTHGGKGIWTWLTALNGVISDNAIRMPEGGGVQLSTYLEEHWQRKIAVTDNDIQARDYTIGNDSRNEEMTIEEKKEAAPT
ncbi:glycosyl hydrolase family 28-related protein [Paenibacillus sp. NPDC058071]|uniref:glycosyl hydrolase family 28-related protein n=1 Tax=Paenibacillus sp. NPDC058071 TaxID=3346326 RepID=UPI0036D91D42